MTRIAGIKRQMLEMLTAAGGSLRKVATGRLSDYQRLNELVSLGYVEKIYRITDAGKAALAHADDTITYVASDARRESLKKAHAVRRANQRKLISGE